MFQYLYFNNYINMHIYITKKEPCDSFQTVDKVGWNTPYKLNKPIWASSCVKGGGNAYALTEGL